MRTIQSVFRSMGRSPLKSMLTLITVGLGVGVLIFALGMSNTFNDLMKSQLEQDGIVVSYANAEMNSEGEMENVRPPQVDANVVDIVSSEVAGVVAISPIAPVAWSEFIVDGTTYRVRAVLGVSEQYADVMSLDLVAGSFFTAMDVELGEKKAVITEGLAEILFGSANEALGQLLQPPAIEIPEGNQDDGARRLRAFSPPTFAVSGVVEDPSELQRKSYGVADMIVPYTSIFPAQFNASQAIRFFMGQGAILVKGLSYNTVEAQLRDVFTRNYGEDFLLEVWEGSPAGSSEYLAETRRTISTFSLVVNLLGFILLAAASIGILSIMLVEALGRSREIALERALGASKAAIVREFFVRSTIVSLISVAIGIALSIFLSGPLTDLIIPIFSGISADQVSGVVDLQSILMGTVSAILIGGIFGVFPVFSVLQVGIADAIREG